MYLDIERETTYKVIEREGYYMVGFSLPANPEKFYPATGFPHRAEREAAELDLETLADDKGLRKARE